MKLDAIDWSVISRRQAGQLRAAARAREQQLAQVWAADPTPANDAAWMAALALEENLHVYAVCGLRPGE